MIVILQIILKVIADTSLNEWTSPCQLLNVYNLNTKNRQQILQCIDIYNPQSVVIFSLSLEVQI